MASDENMTIPSSDPDNVVQIPLSDYVKKLDVKVRERYLKKIPTIGIDPVLIIGKRFEPDCLPPVESTDLLCFLVHETSFYTQKQFKAFRSLEAYNGVGLRLQRGRTYDRKQVRGVGESTALSAYERCLDSNLDYYREGWNYKLRSLFGMQGLAK